AGLISVLKATLGAGLVRFQPTSQSPTTPSESRFQALRGALAALQSQRAAPANMPRKPLAERPRSFAPEGGVCGCQGSSVRTISCLGSTSKRHMTTSVAEIPSAIEWWVL